MASDDLIDLLSENLRNGVACVLATVVRTRPPTSARPGDKAIVDAEGRITGWVGGSCAEPMVRREALLALAEGTPRMVRILPSDEVVETRVSGEVTVATTCPSGGALDVFIEPQLPKPLLVVFGSSPAARTLVQMGALAGFRTAAVHPGARPEDFPGAGLVLPSLDLAAAHPGRDAWAVVASMGHYDEDALEAALAFPGVDVALVASARRAAAVIEALRSRGLDEGTLSRVRTPAGGLRGASQEEIALMALAEVVSLRRSRAAGEVPPPDEPAPRFATDPVCGMAVEIEGAMYTAEHAGRTYHFCGPGCREAFVAEPQRHLART